MEVFQRKASNGSTDGFGSPRASHLLPTDSLGSLRPSLVWLFNHIRQDEERNLTKEDLKKLLGSQMNSSQLDQAFENLDTNGDGEISLDEFIAGFAKFWKEAPHTPASLGEQQIFKFSPSHMIEPLRQRVLVEEHYEYGGEETEKEKKASPSEHFQRMLSALSSHNRHSMEHMWDALHEANPELLGDFEEFVSEVASEVEGAQRALDNQRRATKREAVELDNEIESQLSAAQTTLHIQTHLVRQEEKAKLEKRLVAKESELFSVRNQLQELETEIFDTQRNRQELEQHCLDLSKEKEELRERLEVSERMLEESRSSHQLNAMEELTQQQKSQSQQEEDLLHQKKAYEEEIAKLREQLEAHNTDEDCEGGGVVQPDLLATIGYHRHGDSDERTEDAIVSPLLRRRYQGGDVSPFMRSGRSGTVVKRKKPARKNPGSTPSSKTGPKTSMGRSNSLPNLAELDNLEEDGGGAVASKRHTFFPMNDFSIQVEAPEISAGSLVLSPAHRGSPTTEEEQPDPAYDLLVLALMEQGKEDSPISSDDDRSERTGDSGIDESDKPGKKEAQPLEFLTCFAGTPDFIFKILILGNSYVGKSSYLIRLCNALFSQRYSSTIGVDFYHKTLKLDDKVVSLQLWDTAGQEQFRSVSKAYYRGAQGVILMYDITQEESFIAIKSWINAIKESEVPGAMILVGNKQDRDEFDEREVSCETGETFAKIYDAQFVEASAKTGYNVGNSLLLLVRKLKEYYENQEKLPRKTSTSISLSRAEEKSESRCCSKS